MNKAFAVLAATLVMTASSLAGSISGKLSGVSGNSVVYVDTIAGKTFPAPEQHPVINQKSLQILPHILVVQAGTATSTRGRGECNSFNILRVSQRRIAVQHLTWHPGEAHFRPASETVFHRNEHGWARQQPLTA